MKGRSVFQLLMVVFLTLGLLVTSLPLAQGCRPYRPGRSIGRSGIPGVLHRPQRRSTDRR